jgi:hypothetical protein
MQYKDWLYYVIDANGKSYRKAMGLISAQTDRKPLVYTPNGWQDISIGWERDMALFGEVRNFTLPLKFVLDGAEIMRYLMYENNFDQRVFLLIQKQKLYIDPTNYYFFYDLFYKGELDFTTAKDHENDVQISIAEGGAQKDLKANIGTTYEFPVDEVLVKMDGITLTNDSNFATIPDNQGVNPFLGLNYSVLWLTVLFISNTGTNINAEQASTTPLTEIHSLGPYSDSSQPNNWFYKATENISARVQFEVDMRMFNGTTMELYLKNSNGTRYSLHTITNPNPFGGGWNKTDHVIVDTTINMAAGEQLFLLSQIGRNPLNTTSPVAGSYSETTLTVTLNSKYRTTYVKAVLPATLYNRLANKITPGTATQTNLLGQWNNLAVSSFDAVRGLAGAVVKTSMQDFFDTYNAILNCGMGVVNDTLVLESKDYFLNETNPIPLGRVKLNENSVFTEVLVNTLDIGYESQDSNPVTDVNGRQEFNTTAKYSSPVKKISKKLELISRYRADPFGIENARINLDGKTNTADNSDNDVCILNIDLANPQTDPVLGTYYNLKRGTYDTINGIMFPDSIFNLEDLTPKRMLMRWQSYINSIFYGFSGQYLSWQSLDKNPDLYTMKAGNVIWERQDFPITDSPRLFKPYLFDITPETPIDLVETLQSNPNRCFSFIHPKNGQTYRGFIHKAGIAPNTKSEQSYLLLAAPSDDLKTLEMQ